jgi:hypothetical protein
MDPDRTVTAWVYKSMKYGRFVDIIGIRQVHVTQSKHSDDYSEN